MEQFKFIFLIGFLCFSISSFGQPAAPSGLTATAYDSHIELNWFQNAEPDLSGYSIYQSENEGAFELIKFLGKLNKSYIHFIGDTEKNFQYKITATNTSNQESDFSNTTNAATIKMTDEELLTMVQQYTFRYFWDFAHPVSGMARERNTTSIVTTGGTGFGVMAILVAIERGFITYEEGLIRLTKIVEFLEKAERFHGVFPHWMNGATGEVVRFSEFDDGGDLVETAFLIQGLLTVRQSIVGNSEIENNLKNKITQIWEAVDWNWYRKAVQTVLYWHWSPKHGWKINHAIRGFNEAHIIYILAIASPTHPVPVSLYHKGWAGGNYTHGNTYYTYPLEVGSTYGGPLFFSHYSYLGFDPRNKKDQYTNYFNRNIYHTLINQAYCIDNPKNHNGYSENCWGLTASDDPFGYLAHEPNSNRDNGTISPTAAISSMPYTPDISMAALKHFYRNHGDRLWGNYGFYDAFNLKEDWFAKSYLAIDQGPIIAMIENYRTGLLWNLFMDNPEIQTALDEIGFVEDTTTVVTSYEDVLLKNVGIHVFPNPSSDYLKIELQIKEASENTMLELFDNTGKRMKEIFTNKEMPVQHYELVFNTTDLKNGIYLLRLTNTKGSIVKKILILK